MYNLKIKNSAERDLKRLPKPLFLRLNQKILALREEPRPSGVRKLQGKLEGWRVRVGDYRIVYQIDEAEQTVTIVRIRHRRDVYSG
ncbi:MAG: type II toxin-antitoxin system RelE/ParE family toxin [Ardenticatenaceae bacterium]|nr:type II toxin-antitoxin system RelE/ParE family toxin [Anaerolineales bacterium]MCB8940856.1 type II toxin-antitoxin system RelE/ParE family toxin [Ardenticatenaceae bacterium]MCB8972195.1 type II toxin-antitoxin system RelE/ParE family toxin [Ardenticatenaceae bacterium]